MLDTFVSNSTRCRIADRSLPGGLQLKYRKTGKDYTNVHAKDTLPNKVGDCSRQSGRKDLCKSVKCLFWGLLVNTQEAEADWRLFKASLVSIATPMCGRKRLNMANNGKKMTLRC